MKPDYSSKSGVEQAMAWYEGLTYSDQASVDKKIDRMMAYVKGKSRTPFSKNMGIELIYKMLKVLR